jgi:hypothetical protein
MTKTIRISEKLYNEAKKASEKEHRPISMQIEMWCEAGQFAFRGREKYDDKEKAKDKK